MDADNNMDHSAVRINIEVEDSSESSGIVCYQCGISFSARKNLYRHQRKYHAEKEPSIILNKVCPVCDVKMRTIVDIQKHLTENHNGINLKFETKTFHTDNEFKEWKSSFEKDTVSSFILKGSFKEMDGTVSYYECHRSGASILKNDSKRFKHSKCSGSIKIEKTCPATMKVTNQTVHEATQIIVEYQATHVGHEHEVGKLRLTNEERTGLAEMLRNGIPSSFVLDKVQQQYSPTKRFGLTNRKDIHNIRRDFRIEKTIAHKEDAISVDIIVQKMIADDYNPILVYKPIGESLSDFPQIGTEEFLLGFATEAQMKLLELYGEKCIMLDSTHGTNQYGFQLTTILVNDDNHEGIPVATLFSTRVACETFEPFFKAIKLKLKEDFKTKLILTDDTNSFCNAWTNIFQDDAKHILCAWHVLRNWHSNLKGKVKDETLRLKMKNDMELFLHELDVVTFEKYLKEFTIKYEEETTFLKYFEEHYMNRKEKWAYCHRAQLGVNTNMKLERWHRQLKYEETGGTIMKRLDKSIHAVLKAVTKKLLGRIISIERGKLTHRVSLIRKRHLVAQNLDEKMYSVYEVKEHQWTVAKVEGSSIFTYDISIGNRDCKCDIICSHCGICIHTLTCTCVDYNIRYVICKHIHFFCKTVNFSIKTDAASICSNADDANEGELAIAINEHKELQSFEKSAIVNQLQRKSRTDISAQKASLVLRLQNISNQIQALEALEDLNGAAELTKTLEMYLQTVSSKRSLPSIPDEVKNTPTNKVIDPQRKFTNKKKYTCK
ncbi:uncharacterized protein LOC129959193 [Argiope bruennichi]|uniref:uncharacterized protein LOC129959193 n=1 Tax=Argiope bruennichi TaxID=94029 RepID=UPI002494B933|nr:uncharacterized protein LOC129959193 [Argiope bruennichi]